MRYFLRSGPRLTFEELSGAAASANLEKKPGEADLNLKLAIPIVLLLAATLAWTFAAPYVEHWRARRAAARRRLTEGRRK